MEQQPKTSEQIISEIQTGISFLETQAGFLPETPIPGSLQEQTVSLLTKIKNTFEDNSSLETLRGHFNQFVEYRDSFLALVQSLGEQMVTARGVVGRPEEGEVLESVVEKLRTLTEIIDASQETHVNA